MDFYGLGFVCFRESHVADFSSKNVPPGPSRTRGTMFPLTLQYTEQHEGADDNAVRPKGSFQYIQYWYDHEAAKAKAAQAKGAPRGDEEDEEGEEADYEEDA